MRATNSLLTNLLSALFAGEALTRYIRPNCLLKRKTFPLAISLEIGPSISEAKYAYDKVESWARPEKPAFSINFSFMRPVVYKEPKGTVLIISPFNYPLWLTISPLVSSFRKFHIRLWVTKVVAKSASFSHLAIGWSYRRWKYRCHQTFRVRTRRKLAVRRTHPQVLGQRSRSCRQWCNRTKHKTFRAPLGSQ